MDFGILGALRVADDQGRELPLGGQKQRALLAILLLHANEPLSSDRLIEQLWGEHPPQNAHKSLQVHVSRLRRALEDGVPNGESVVVTRPSGYLLRLTPGQLDLERFERLVAEGTATLSKGEPERAAERLRAALSLWRGEALADLAYEPFAHTEVERLEELRLAATELRIDAELALGRHGQLVSELAALVRAHPFRERLQAQLMVALYRAGRQAEALAAYRAAREALVEELGIEPSAELRELERAVLAQDPGLAASACELAVDGRPAGEGAPFAVETPPARPRRVALVAAAGAAALALAALGLLLGRGSGQSPHPALAADSHAVAVVNPVKGVVTQAASVGASPGPLAYDAQTHSLWVGNRDDETVTHIDTKRRSVGRTLPIGGALAGLAGGGGSVWVASTSPSRPWVFVRKVDPRFDSTVSTLRIASLPGGDAALALAAGKLWVAPSLGLLTRVAARSASVRGKGIDTRHTPSAVAAGAGAVWLADGVGNSVVRVDEESGVTTTTPVGNGPDSIAIGEGAVWVTLGLDDSLLRIDPDTGSVTKVISVGRSPAGLAVGFGSVWVANSGDGTISQVDPRAGSVTRTIDVGASPQNVAIGDGRVWVSVSPRALAEAKPGGEARLESHEDVDTLDPALAQQIVAWRLEAATEAKLLNYPDRAGPAGSQLVPEVAEALPARSGDGKTYTFHIRPGFRFSPPSNQPVTAQTFKYTIERSLNPRMHGFAPTLMTDLAGAAAYASGKARHIAGVTATGNTLRIRLTRPAADLPARLALPYFSAVPIGTPIDPKGVRLVPSAGPYYVASYTPGQGVLLERNPNYHGNRPRRLARIQLAVGQRNPVADVAQGKADYAPEGVRLQSARRQLAGRYGAGSAAARAGHQQYFTPPVLATELLALNASRPLFSSARMRQAVNYAIDRRALARARGGNFALPEKPLAGYLPLGIPGYSDERLYPLTPDLARARRLAGHRRRRAALWTMNFPPMVQAAAILKNNLHAIGIDAQVRLFAPGVYYEKVSTRGARFDIAAITWVADYPDPADFLMLFDGRAIQPSDNSDFSYFNDPRFNRRLDATGRLSGPRRYLAFRRLALDLARSQAPWAAYASDTWADLVSARMGCVVEQPIYGLDLTALCLRRSH